jgi:heme/copper-type cytochrome/quinol oxidase subunit 2
LPIIQRRQRGGTRQSRLAPPRRPDQLSRIISQPWTDVIFWLAAFCCALSQAAIVRSALRARTQRPDGSASPPRAIDVAWTIVPALGLVLVLVVTWRVLHAAPLVVP